MSGLTIVIVVAAIACGLGMRLLRWVPGLAFNSFLERAVFGAAIGLAVIAYVILGMGLAGVLYAWAIIVALVVAAAISWRDIGVLVGGIARGLRAAAGGPVSLGGVAVTLFLIAMIALGILGALAPSSTNDWDGLSYHLAVPKLYLQAHDIHFIGWLSHSNFPFTLEMLYAGGLALDGQGAAKLFHTLCAALLVLGMVAFGGAYWERRHGALAAVVLLSAPIVGWEMTSALNDLAAALFTLLSVYAFINWSSGRGERWLVLAGALCGFALGVKATALGLLGFLAVAVLYQRAVSERAGIGAGLRAAVVLGVVAVVVGSPWYIKTYLWTGNPVFPFFYDWFGGKYWTAEAARLYREEQLGFGTGHSVLALVLVPWNLTMHGNMFSNFPDRPLVYTSVGPLFLALTPALLVLGRLDKRVKFLLVYTLVAACAWFFMSQHIRYAIPLLPALALCAGFAGSEILSKAAKELRTVALVAIVLVCVMSLATVVFLAGDGARAALGVESKESYLMRTLGPLYAMAEVVDGLPAESKVIMYGETRGFYFDTPYMWGNHHHNMIQYDRLSGADQLISAYRALGVTHVLMTADFMKAVEGRGSKLAALLADCLELRAITPVATRGDLTLFSISERGA